jgi:hypothetical protein
LAEAFVDPEHSHAANFGPRSTFIEAEIERWPEDVQQPVFAPLIQRSRMARNQNTWPKAMVIRAK